MDDLDKRIIQYLSLGTNSYQELARNCNVTRNTIYRRITTLENRGIIKNILSCVVNLEKMDITPINIGVRIKQANQNKAINLLKNNKYVKFLWRTYGENNLILLVFCPKGKEGVIIQDIRAVLEGLNADNICVSVGFTWEKMNYSPFDNQPEIETRITQIIENRY